MRHFIFLLGIGSLGCSSTASYQGDDSETTGSVEFSSTSNEGSGSAGGTGGTGDTAVEPSSDTMATVSAATATASGGASVTSESSSMATSVSASASTTDSTGGVTSTTTGAAGSDSSSGSVTSAGGSGGSTTSTETTSGGGAGGASPTTSTESTSTTGDIEPVECNGLTLYRRCSAVQGYPWYASGDNDSANSVCVREVDAECPGAVAIEIPAGHCLRFQAQYSLLTAECAETNGSPAYSGGNGRVVKFLVDPGKEWAAYMWADPTGLCSNIGKTGSIPSCANTYGPCGLYEETWTPRDCQ